MSTTPRPKARPVVEPAPTPSTPAPAENPARPRRRKARLPRLGVRREDAAEMIGVSVPTWDRMAAGGKTPAALRVGGCVVYSVRDLRMWMDMGCPDRAEFEARKAALATSKAGKRGAGR